MLACSPDEEKYSCQMENCWRKLFLRF